MLLVLTEIYLFKFNRRINVGTVSSKSGMAGAVDLSYSYFNEDVVIGSTDATLSFGANISNIGNKIAYTVSSSRDFLPTNLRLGTALNLRFDKYNSLTTTIDFNKLLVRLRQNMELTETLFQEWILTLVLLPEFCILFMMHRVTWSKIQIVHSV